MKNNNNFVTIFFKSLQMYVMNIHKFLLYMAFPILGQLAGIVLIFIPALYLKDNLPELSMKYAFFADPIKQLGLVFIAILPGLVLFASAFWKYLVAYVALNSMTHSAMTSGKVYDFSAHNAVVYRNLWSYIVLWFIISILMIIACNPFLMIIGGIFFIYFILVFQIFTFEGENGVLHCFKTSLQLIKGNFIQTALLAIILLFVAWGIAQGCEIAINKIYSSDSFLANISWLLVSTPFINTLNQNLQQVSQIQITPNIISQALFSSTLSFIIFGFTLPLRSICWTFWYKNLGGKTSKCEVKKSGKGKKKIKRELDPEILRRANLNDDEEV